ncbi:dihydroxy-acid/6-phosphogluconate dehydratase [Aspergillus karnatakaensis]|uniref:dihydroxy-acid/6-phosphogluconate dehydratase n=1 Tax=Aspergillus karnatakaensis TaxID=1810916 RepID=UPI003CCCA803
METYDGCFLSPTGFDRLQFAGKVQLKPLLYLDTSTITGATLGQVLASANPMSVPRDLSCIQPFSSPLYPASSLVVLRGNLAPGGAVIKASASKHRELLRHSGRAVVFKNSAHLAETIDDPDLDVSPEDILVVQNIGPVGNPGMPEAGMIPIPRKLSAKGVTDIVRISDGRTSGTAGGTIVLHVSPEAADPESVLGLVRSGDAIELDAERGVLNVKLTEEEIARRKELRRAEIEDSGTLWVDREKTRGYRGLYMRSVTQAEYGADFDFLKANGPA